MARYIKNVTASAKLIGSLWKT